MSEFQGKNIVVTGAASGIGLAVTLYLAERGATVWVNDISPSPPKELQAWIDQKKVHFQGSVDVADRVAARKFIDDVVSKAGRLDGLVNNAGIGLLEGPIASDDAYDRMINVNIGGVWFYGTAALKVMQKQEPLGPWKTRGSIVNIASGAGMRGVGGLAVYCATKHAVIGLSRSWQEDFGQYGIRTNSVAPGTLEVRSLIHSVISLIWKQEQLLLRPLKSECKTSLASLRVCRRLLSADTLSRRKLQPPLHFSCRTHLAM